MIRARSDDGYALLAALVIMALAAVFAATSVAAVMARQNVAAADDAAARAAALERRALAAAFLTARRGGWEGGTGAIAGGAAAENGRWRASWSLMAHPSAAGWPEFAVRAEGACGPADRSVDAVVQLRQEPFICGLVVWGDMEVAAALEVDGSGLYCGGSVRGREWVSFGPADVTPTADGVHGDLWPQAGVHALGGIWVRGAEEHDRGPLLAPEDTDTHSAVNAVMSAVSAPSADWLDTVNGWADDPGGALDHGVLRMDRIPSVRGALDGRATGSGFIFRLPCGDAPVRVEGVRPSGWCPVLLVSEADVILGDPTMDTSFDGAVVASGWVDVEGSTSIGGGVYAGTLRVAGPLTVTVAPAWRSRQIPGLVLPVIIAQEASASAGN